MSFSRVCFMLLLVTAQLVSPVVCVHQHRLLHNAKIGSSANTFADVTCDNTLSWEEFIPSIPKHPELGGTLFISQQLDCGHYNRSRWFVDPNQPKPDYADSSIILVQPPPSPFLLDGVAWEESIYVEPTFDPLAHDRSRWLWAADGRTLIWDEVFEHHANQQQPKVLASRFAATIEVYKSVNGTTVNRERVFSSRSFVTPDDNGEGVKVEFLHETTMLNKTAAARAVGKEYHHTLATQ
ncbi:hypothetical protein QOT17_007040 [Balamuthia mandrillaris]